MTTSTQTGGPLVGTTPDVHAAPALRVWSAGDYRPIGVALTHLSENLVEAVDLRWGEAVLDVASGNGSAALAAARRGARVTSSDLVPALLEHGARRAAADGLEMETVVADAHDLPFPDASFDVVISAIGVMFASDQQRAADELVRVLRPGGRVGLLSWTPEGFLGELFRTIVRHAPPPTTSASPFRWGTEDGLRELLGTRVRLDVLRRDTFRFRAASPEEYVAWMATNYGPLLRALERVDERAGQALKDDLAELVRSSNVASDGTAAFDKEFLVAVATRIA